MKKTHLGLWLMLLLCIGCSQDESAPVQSLKKELVNISTHVNYGMKTRAGEVPALEGYTLRYILEIRKSYDSELVYRSEQLQSDGEIKFSFELPQAGSYQLLAWADFIPTPATGSEIQTPNVYTHYPDLYYRTDSEKGLEEVALIPEAYKTDEVSRDAFYCAQHLYKDESEAYTATIVLNRPFGQLNLIEKNVELMANVESMTCSYQVPKTFNLISGCPGEEMHDIQVTGDSWPTPTEEHKANVLYDYIFVPQGNSYYLGAINFSFTSKDEKHIFRDVTISANKVPVMRNKHTNASGYLLHLNSLPDPHVDITITVDNMWDEDLEHEMEASQEGKLPQYNNNKNPFK